MKLNVASMKTLSTGRHVLAFREAPPAPILLSPTAALVLGLVSTMPPQEARADFIGRMSSKLTDAGVEFDRRVDELARTGLLDTATP